MSFLHHRHVCMLIKEENTEGDSTLAVSSSTGLTLFVFTYLGGGFLFYSWWRLTGVRMTCRDRTSEFQSACKSLQSRPVRWHRTHTPSHCPVLVDGLWETWNGSSGHWPLFIFEIHIMSQQFTHVLFTLINMMVTSYHSLMLANYIKCKHVFPPVAEWSPAHQTGSQRPQAAQRLHSYVKVRNTVHKLFKFINGCFVFHFRYWFWVLVSQRSPNWKIYLYLY